MANIRKSFNFRDGVQVDEDDLVVRGNLVGIGTSVPSERLDVRGDAKIVGLVTANNLYVGSGGTVSGTLNVGTGITFYGSSGIISARELYGDGSTLSNLPTSQWIDIDVGLGFTSIYAQGNVGISTIDPRYNLQIGGNPTGGERGVGINSRGSIYASGIITATSFVGFGSGITEINASNISSGTVNNDRLPVIQPEKFPSGFSVSGIITSSGGFVGNLTGNVTGNLTGNVNSSGVSTFSAGIIGNVTGIASTARSLTGTPDISVGVVTAFKIITNSLEVLSAPVGVSTIADKLNVGTGGTGFTAQSVGKIGVGTASPTADIQLLKEGTGATLDLVGTGGEVRISIGQSIGVGNSTAMIRYGTSQNTLDFLNRSIGNINTHIHTGTSGVGTGNFNWIYGQSNTELMTLTYTGRLGLGKTNPDQTLHVVGTSTVTSDSYIGGDLRISGAIRFANGSVIGGTSSVIPANIYATTGISTVSQLNVVGVASIGIGTSKPKVGLDAYTQSAFFNTIGIATNIVSGSYPQLFVQGNAAIVSKVGVGTTTPLSQITDPQLGSLNAGDLQVFGQTNIYNNNLIVRGVGAIGINSDLPIGPLDMRYANLTASLRGVFYPPVLTTAQINSITPSYIGAGAIIFNSSTGKHQGYDGSSWNDLY